MPWHDPPLRAGNTVILADGVHDGVRWWLQRLDGLPGLQLTVSGYVGNNAVIEFAEFATANATTVEGWLARLLDKKRVGWAKKAEAAAVAKPTATPPAPALRPMPKRPKPARMPPWSQSEHHPGHRGGQGNGVGQGRLL